MCITNYQYRTYKIKSYLKSRRKQQKQRKKITYTNIEINNKIVRAVLTPEYIYIDFKCQLDHKQTDKRNREANQIMSKVLQLLLLLLYSSLCR